MTNVYNSIEPTVYLNSYFGDGNQAIVYSNINCGGFEGGLSDCEKQQYGSFTCSRNNIVGIVCRDSGFSHSLYNHY